MKVGLLQAVTASIALALSVATVLFVALYPVQMGEQTLPVRALILSFAILMALVALYPFSPLFAGRPSRYGGYVCLPAIIPAFIYYLVLLPNQTGVGLSAEQLQSQLITDSSSNGIVEVGFSYPIYTPTLRLSNHELFTREANVFLRMIDANGEVALFRAVRSNIPGNSLSVEATVRGMLSENEEYLFIPLQLPPKSSVTGRVVFIISNLDDGSTFTEALGRAYQAQFELRDPVSGELLFEFPLEMI
jgi:hypothetical protein